MQEFTWTTWPHVQWNLPVTGQLKLIYNWVTLRRIQDSFRLWVVGLWMVETREHRSWVFGSWCVWNCEIDPCEKESWASMPEVSMACFWCIHFDMEWSFRVRMIQDGSCVKGLFKFFRAFCYCFNLVIVHEILLIDDVAQKGNPYGEKTHIIPFSAELMFMELCQQRFDMARVAFQRRRVN